MYNLVLKNGYVIDPVNNKEDYYDVAIKGGKIEEVCPKISGIKAEKTINLKGLYMCPGLIDVHVHVTSKFAGPSGYRMIAKSGVTTALDFAGPIDEVLETIKKWGSGINFGCCDAVMPSLLENIKNPTGEEIKNFIEKSIKKGAFGIKILGGHFPLTPENIRKVIEICNQKMTRN